MSGRCRLCAGSYQDHIEILEDSQFLSMIDYFFQLKLAAQDKLPSIVCEGCYEFVQQTWHFKEQVDRAQILLSELILSAVEAIVTNTGSVEHTITKTLGNDDTLLASSNNALVSMISKRGYNEDNENLKAETQGTSEINTATEPGCSSEKTKEKSLEKTICKIEVKFSKKTRKRSVNSKKIKSNDTETFKEIDYINPDGTVVPKAGIGGWNTYPLTCSECSAVCFEVDDLREHYTSNHNIVSVRYLCLDCPKVYSKYISFISHVRHHRPILKYSCDICYKWYATSKEVEDHQSSHNEENPHHCTICGKRFRVQSLLNLHTRSHLPSDVKNCYPCNHCPKKFATKPNLMAHKRIHLGIKEYTCDQCGKSFVQKGNLDNHILIHDSSRPFHCNVCEKSFKTLIRLKKHGSIHSGLKPHQCDICGKRFRERGTLKEHHRIHTGVMPFTCEFCGKCFRFKGVLTTHRRQHTGERPYSCTECQHHFTNWPNYNKHMKRRHGINTSVNCRTKQDIPPTGKPNRNPPGTVLAAPQPTGPAVQVICQTNPAPLEVYSETPSAGFYPVLGLYGIPEDITKGVI
ncbi:zinc finger protein 570-like [Euwallacea fornicatus]|uniref:zinc finger protein 570-like n=1 Tax=Euwallacea fornicatus TaxID=995702 RepID=UPI00338D57C1